MKKSALALIFGSALFLAACGGGDDNASSGGGETEKSVGETLVQKNCTTCHGGNLQGMGQTPALNDVGGRLSADEIKEIVTNGTTGGMPPYGKNFEAAEIDEIVNYLAEQK